jgi:hypothetical protein
LNAIEALKHSGIIRIEAITQALLNTTNACSSVLIVEALGKFCSSQSTIATTVATYATTKES